MNDRTTEYRHSPAVTIRRATPADATLLETLAELDEAAIPDAPVLAAFVEDELWAAISLSTGALISDPFRRTAEIAELLLARGRQLTVPDRPRFGWIGRRRRASPARRLGLQAQPR